MKNKKGVSLFETLIVIVLFAALGLLTTRIILLSLRGSTKSSAIVRVRENLDYAISVIERNVRNADSLLPCTSDTITYVDSNSKTGYFKCFEGEKDGYVASGSARLTNTDISITSCTITCETESSSDMPWVEISLAGKDAAKTGIESASADISTRIYLRQY